MRTTAKIFNTIGSALVLFSAVAYFVGVQDMSTVAQSIGTMALLIAGILYELEC